MKDVIRAYSLLVGALWNWPSCKCGLILLPLGVTALSAPWPAVQLIALGAGFGFVLSYFNFGFTRAFSLAIEQRNMIGIHALLIMLLLSSVLFFPLLLKGDGNGFYRPISLGLVLGSLLFGLGMFSAKTCTSGALTRVGKLQISGLLTLVGLMVGGIGAAYTYSFWQALPSLSPINFLDLFEGKAFLIQLALIGSVFYVSNAFRNKKINSFLLSDHPWVWAAILLSIGNLVTLLVLKQPWSIATVFPYWGLKLNEALSGPIEDWYFWDYTAQMQAQFDKAPWEMTISLMALGVMVGAFIGKLSTPFSHEDRSHHKTAKSPMIYIMPVVGGLCMGYGAIISYGCNIGALFSGISSGSLHGWIWFIGAFTGYAAASYLSKRIKR